MGGLCAIVFQNSIQYKHLNMIIKTYYQNYWKTLITYYTVMNSNAMTVGGEGGTSRPWSYGSWIYNYLCNQCQSPPIDVCEFESQSGWDVYHLCDNVCQWLATGRWFSPGPSVSSTNKTDRHNITEIYLKVALNTIKHRGGSRISS